MQQDTFIVPAHRLDTLLPRLNKLVKKANKYGNEPIGYTVGEKQITKKLIANHGNNPETILVETVAVTVWGNAPKYGNYTFAAKVELFGEENIVHNMANIDLDPRFRTMVSTCDHCGHNRVRNNVFVFVDGNGKQLAVGSSCLHDFTGCDNPLEIANRATFASDVKDICDDEESAYYGSFGEYNFKAIDILQSAAANIRNNGWISKTVGIERDIMPTADYVVKDMLPNGKWKPCEIIACDIEQAQMVLDYFRNAANFKNDYLNNIRVILKQDYVAHRHLALVASGVQYLIKEQSKKIEADKTQSKYVGNVGDKLKEITVIFEKEIFIGQTQFGDKYLYQFNSNGNAIVWFTDKKQYEIGMEYTMNATVKELKTYNGINQTIVTRAKLK